MTDETKAALAGGEPLPGGDALDPEAVIDNDAVDRFSEMMRKKMALSRANGRSGWHDPNKCSPDYLRKLLYEHIEKGDPVDVANICMMLRHYQEPTFPRPAEPAQAGVDWEQRRWEAMLAAMGGLLADPDMNADPEPVARTAKNYADALIAAAKGGKP